MRLSHLLHNSLQLLVGTEDVVIHLVHLLCQFHDLIVRLLDQLPSNLQTLLPTLYPSQDLLYLPVNLFIHFFPFLHLRQLHLSSILRSTLIADNSVVILSARLEELLSHFCVGLLFSSAE